MRDMLVQYAQSPDCILGVFPDNGGSWLSPLHPPQLRNFKAVPMTWTTAKTAANGIGTDNWSFEIKLNLKAKITGEVFNNVAGSSLKLYDDLVSSGEASFFLRNYVDTATWTGWHSIRLDVVDGTVALYLDGELQGSKATNSTTVQFDQASVSSADIEIESVSFTNLTTGKLVWQAPYTDLYVSYLPRDFNTSYQWNTLQTVLNTSLPWTDDYHFSFDFTVADDFENGRYWIMYQSNGRIAFALEKDARGFRFVFGSHSFNGDGVYIYAPFASSLAGRHEVTLAVEGATLRVTADGTVYEQTGERVESSEYNRVITTKAPVTIHSISLADDTTNTVLWQASISDLYESFPPPPWPSPVPENFAEKAKAFYDYQAVVQEVLDPTHDYSFLIDFKLDEAKTSGNVFYAIPSDAPFTFVWQSNNQIDFFTNLLKPKGGSNSFASIYAYYQSDVKLQGRHQIECKIEANMLSSYLDGVLVAQKTSNLERTGTATVGLPNCNSGYVYKIQITDLTDNQVVWSYPSEAERVRLITKTNVRTDRGAFEAADPVQSSAGNWWIDTQIDLRGYTGDISMLAVAKITPSDTPLTLLFCGQGRIGSSGNSVSGLYMQTSATESAWVMGFYISFDGTNTTTCTITGKAAIEPYMNKWITMSGVMDRQSGVMRFHLDGKVVATATIPSEQGGLVSSVSTAKAEKFIIGNNAINGSFDGNYLCAVKAAMLFNRALSANEIAAMAPTKSLLSWAGIQAAVRSGQAQAYFKVNDILTTVTPRWTIDWQVVGFDQVQPADDSLVHSMTLLPVRLVISLQFDAPELEYMLTDDQVAASWKFLQFHTPDAVSGGLLVLIDDTAAGYDRQWRRVSDGYVLQWDAAYTRWAMFNTAGAAVIASAVTQSDPWDCTWSIDGYYLTKEKKYYQLTNGDYTEVTVEDGASVAGLYEKNPDANRAIYGCNRWDWSSVRQWLNSNKPAGEWYSKQSKWGKAPSYAFTTAGFMADLPADFLSVIAPARLVTALSGRYGSGSIETIDRFWLPSRTEIFGDANNGVAEGVLMTKYVDATDADRIKQHGKGVASRWWLRSANVLFSHPVFLVTSEGTFFGAGHGASQVMGIVPACIIA